MFYSFYNWRYDSKRAVLFYRNKEVVLRRKNVQLLHYMLSKPQQLLLREDVLLDIWRSRHVSDESLTTCVKELRKTFAKHDPENAFILTRHGMGYEFVPDVYWLADRFDCAHNGKQVVGTMAPFLSQSS